MTIQLYFAPGACSFVPHVLLESAGAAFEPVMVKLHKGEQHGEAYKAINPRGQVPVLVDSGETITQIIAIVSYINDLFPHMHYLPSQPLAKARVLQTLAWMNNTVHPTFTHIFMPQKFTDNPAIHADLKSYNTPLLAQQLADIEALVGAAQAHWARSMRMRLLCCVGAACRALTLRALPALGHMCKNWPLCRLWRASLSVNACS
jgi:glutathione S-transferase